jgi:Flp pilus assembly protein TadG
VAVVELVLLTPVLVVLVLLAVALGRLGASRLQIDDVAADAARAASRARSAPEAADAARDAATTSLASHALTCRPLDVAVDVSGFRPGGRVVVELACGVSLGRFGSLWSPQGRALTARAVAAVETYRGVG